MSDPTVEILLQTVQRLQSVVARLEQRVGALETGAGPHSVDGTASEESEPSFGPSTGSGSLSPAKVWYLAGRSVLVLAGAYLLRFMTEGGTIPPLPGALAGLLYCLVLTWLLDRSGARSDRLGAVAHGLTVAAIAYPLIAETGGDRSLLTPPLAMGSLAIITAAGIGAAWRQHLRFLAWTFTLASMVVVLALIKTAGAYLEGAAFLLFLGAGTCALAYTRHWHLKRWLVGGLLNVLLLWMVITTTGDPERIPHHFTPSGVQILAFAHMMVYLGIFTWRALVKGRGVKVFDVTQSIAAVTLGFGGAVRIAQTNGQGAGLLGWFALLSALAGYAVAFVFVRSRLGRGKGFFYFASLALVFLVIGSLTVAHGSWLVWCWVLLGLAAAGLGAAYRRVTLRFHAAIYVFLASVYAGLSAASFSAFMSPADSDWAPLGLSSAVVMLAAIAGYLTMARGHRKQDRSVAQIVPRMFLAAIFLGGAGHLVVALLVNLVAGQPPAADPALTGLVRTVVLALTAVTLAFISRRSVLPELSWLVYPVLLFACIKMVIEDLQVGNALTLCVGFALLGTALILAPRTAQSRIANIPQPD
ncbi:MAG: hypothetical protein ABIK96_06685 [bacterium]